MLLVIIDRHADRVEGREAVTVAEEDKFHLSDIYKFERPYWLIITSCVLLYSVLFPFLSNVCNLMLQQKYGYSETEAGTANFLPYLISAILAAPLGYMIDKIGKRALVVMFSSLLITLSMIICMLQPGSPDPENVRDESVLLPLILLGVGYSIYACALWGSIPYTVPDKMFGSAFGICTSIQQVGLTLTPIILAYTETLGKTKAVFNSASLIFLTVLGTIGIVFNVMLYLDDINNRGGQLDKVDAKEKQ